MHGKSELIVERSMLLVSLIAGNPCSRNFPSTFPPPYGCDILRWNGGRLPERILFGQGAARTEEGSEDVARHPLRIHSSAARAFLL